MRTLLAFLISLASIGGSVAGAATLDWIKETGTMTLSRREQVDFSLPTFVTGATLLYRKDGPKSLRN